MFAVDTVLLVKCKIVFLRSNEPTGGLTAVKDKERFRARACGRP
jgi:hypothetical protein